VPLPCELTAIDRRGPSWYNAFSSGRNTPDRK
jgi:hypothetical protein